MNQNRSCILAALFFGLLHRANPVNAQVPIPQMPPSDSTKACQFVVNTSAEAMYRSVEDIFGGPMSDNGKLALELPDTADYMGEKMKLTGKVRIYTSPKFTDRTRKHYKLTVKPDEGTRCKFRGVTYLFRNGKWKVQPPTP